MKLRLYNDIEKFLYSIRVDDKQIISHVGLWNEEITNMVKNRPFKIPAVFIEFLPCAWGQLGNGAKQADIMIRLHIITATLAMVDTQYRSEALFRFELIRNIADSLSNMGGADDERGTSYTRFQYLESLTDHNYGQVIEDIEGFRTHCIVKPIFDETQKWIWTKTNVSLDLGDVFADPFADQMC